MRIVMKKSNVLAILLVALGLGSLVFALGYSAFVATPYSSQSNGYQSSGYSNHWMMGQPSQPLQTSSNTQLTLDQAKVIAQQYLASTGNSNLAVKEIMEFQYNFYVIYYEKDTGRGAFEMLIWKQTPPSGSGIGGGMMGGGMMYGRVTTGVMMPEPGPNMMWNTKYSPMASGFMGYVNRASGTMTVSQASAQQLAQAYLDTNIKDAKTEMATQFYGYYTFDFTIGGKISGMLSVNGYTGQVWYHSWHGSFIQEVEFT